MYALLILIAIAVFIGVAYSVGVQPPVAAAMLDGSPMPSAWRRLLESAAGVLTAGDATPLQIVI